MDYTAKELENALSVQRTLIDAGVDPDYVELKIRLAADLLGEDPGVVARSILAETPDKWKGSPAPSKGGASEPPGGTSNERAFYDELRRRIRAELDAKKGPDMRAELDRRTGRSGGGR